MPSGLEPVGDRFLSDFTCLSQAMQLGPSTVFCSVAVAIQTAAMDMLGGDGIGKQCRTADIMADAAYAVLSRPKDYTGQFLVDEDVLKKEGIQDFDPYAVQRGRPAQLSSPPPALSWCSLCSVHDRQVTRCCQTFSWTRPLRIWLNRWRSMVK